MNGEQKKIVGAPGRFNEALTGAWTLEMVNSRLGATWKSRKTVASKRLIRTPVTGQGFPGRLQYVGEYKQVQVRVPVLEDILENHAKFKNRDTTPEYKARIQIENKL